ncbi:ATP-binding protein [Streptomyces flavofungini]|uniref:ATP-binding protein n=1 Tax=Streptomyces flavofungini TaxID=68200 RepID=UPI0025B20559|nr:ATP-binding protein [Streptomyces flavofungini]WJV51733.1 ATP-binding protein [Streptomyces flavofungini]
MTIMVDKEAPMAPGFYLKARTGGFTVHLHASAEHVRRIRELTARTLDGAGVGADIAHSAELVASELVGNAVRACGPFAPLVVDVQAGADAVAVSVHDPDGEHLPRRGCGPLDDPHSESGRGLLLVDLLAPGWQAVLTPIGKQICCRLPLAEGDVHA